MRGSSILRHWNNNRECPDWIAALKLYVVNGKLEAKFHSDPKTKHLGRSCLVRHRYVQKGHNWGGETVPKGQDLPDSPWLRMESLIEIR